MNTFAYFISAVMLLLFASSSAANEQKKTNEQSATEANIDLGSFGFAPALFIINYKEPILLDPKDARVRSDGLLEARTTRSTVTAGVEAHYSFNFGARRYKPAGASDWTTSEGHTISPFVGLFDLQNGINGYVLGALYGYWRGDKDFKKTTVLNFGVGYTVHKGRTVLAKDLKPGVKPPDTLQAIDYTTTKDVKGVSLMISVALGF